MLRMLSRLSQPSGRKGLVARKTYRRDRSDSADWAAQTWWRGRKLPHSAAGDHPRPAHGGYHEPPGMEAALSSSWRAV